MFQFVVRRLHWLASVPLAPQLFDALLLAWTAVFHWRRLRVMDALEAATHQMPGVGCCTHRYGGIGFVRGGHEFAHLHGNGLLDVQLTRDRAVALTEAGRAEPHHVFGSSAWVSYWVREEGDLDGALALIREGAGIPAVGSHLDSSTRSTLI